MVDEGAFIRWLVLLLGTFNVEPPANVGTVRNTSEDRISNTLAKPRKILPNRINSLDLNQYFHTFSYTVFYQKALGK